MVNSKKNEQKNLFTPPENPMDRRDIYFKPPPKPTEKVSSRIDKYGWCCGFKVLVGKHCHVCGDKMT